MHKKDNNQKIFDNHGYITQSGDIVNFKGANIANQNNYFFTFNFNWIFKSFNWIFKSFNNKELNTKQFLFLLFSKSILFFLLIGLFLLPFFSINKHNIGFFEFTGAIGVFIFLCSWYWKRIKKEKPEASI